MPPDDGFRIAGSRTLVQSSFLRLDRLHVAAPGGTSLLREVVRHPGAVAVVPVVDDRVVLIRQYRAPVDRHILEIPAGKLDVAGEDPAAAAARELEEEVGYSPDVLEVLSRFYTGPGFTDEHMTVYLATGCTPVPMAPHGAEEEDAEIVEVPIGDLRELLAADTIDDAKTLVGLLMLLERIR